MAADMQAARDAIDTLRPLCNSPAAQNALKTVESDVLGSDHSKGAPPPKSRQTPGAVASGSAPAFGSPEFKARYGR